MTRTELEQKVYDIEIGTMEHFGEEQEIRRSIETVSDAVLYAYIKSYEDD